MSKHLVVLFHPVTLLLVFGDWNGEPTAAKKIHAPGTNIERNDIPPLMTKPIFNHVVVVPLPDDADDDQSDDEDTLGKDDSNQWGIHHQQTEGDKDNDTEDVVGTYNHNITHDDEDDTVKQYHKDESSESDDGGVSIPASSWLAKLVKWSEMLGGFFELGKIKEMLSNALSTWTESMSNKKENGVVVREKRDTRTFRVLQNNMCSCGMSYPKDKIVNGRESEIDEFPWLAALLRYDGLEIYQMCGASIINDRYLLSAAHCFNDEHGAKNLYASLADHDLSSLIETQSLTVKAKEVIIHSGYIRITHENDIALVKLTKPLVFTNSIIPICMPDRRETYAGKKAIIAGWGATAFRGPAPDVQLKAEIRVTSHAECVRKYIFGFSVIKHSQLCGSDPTKDTCQGDSGGPLIVKKDHHFVQPGIVSFGRGCANPDFPGVYTRVTSFLDWILEHTKDGVYCKGSVEP